MSERTESAHVEQEQSASQAPDAVNSPTEPSTPPPVGDEPSGPDPATILRQFTTAARTAATAALRMGALAKDYVTARMTLSDVCQREACVKCLVGAWQEFSDNVITPVRVNELIRASAAWETFNTVTAFKAGKVALRVVREFSPLLERDVNSREERWTIISTLEERARALWLEVTSKSLTGEECAAAVATLVESYKRELAEQAAQRAAAPDATPEQKKEAEKTQEDANKASAAAQKKAERTTTKGKTSRDGVQAPKPEPCRQGTNLLAQLAETAKAGSSKDFGSMLAQSILKSDDALATAHDTFVSLITDSKTPDDMVRALLTAAKSAQAALSRPMIRAVDAALLIVEKGEKDAKKKAS